MTLLKNQVNLIGRLGKDVDLRNLESGSSLAKFTLATNEYYKNNKGETIKETQWHNIIAWGKTAEVMSKLLQKGNEVMIQGKIEYNSYEDKEGKTRYTSQIKVNDFVKLTKEEKADLPI